MSQIVFKLKTRDGSVPSISSITYVFRGRTFIPDSILTGDKLTVLIPETVRGHVSVELVFETLLAPYHLLRGFDTTFQPFFDAGEVTINDEAPSAFIGGQPGTEPSYVLNCGNPDSINPKVTVKDAL